MMKSKFSAPVGIGLAALALTLAACGGGGGGTGAPGGGGGVIPVGPTSGPSTPTPTATPSPAPTATPSVAPSLSYSGKVVDDAGSAVTGATVQVYISSGVYGGVSPMSKRRLSSTARTPSAASGAVTAVTGADGSFALAGVPAGTFRVVAFSPDGSHANYHGLATAGAAASLHMSRLSASQVAWIAKINADRAKYGSPAVSADDSLVEAATYRAAYMGTNGYYGHGCPASDPACLTGTQVADRAQNDPGVGPAENADEAPASSSTWQTAQGGFMAEAANCPQPASPATCPFAENTGHFLNVTRPAAVFVGVGEYDNGKPSDPAFVVNQSYYVEEFE